jgi:hypothetical protein
VQKASHENSIGFRSGTPERNRQIEGRDQRPEVPDTNHSSPTVKTFSDKILAQVSARFVIKLRELVKFGHKTSILGKNQEI